VAGPRIPILYIQIDGTGVPVTVAETQGRQGKQSGQSAHTREAKARLCLHSERTDVEGRPIRDENSTSYVGAIETAEQFGLRIYTEAWRRGWDRADLKSIHGDGAVWIWNIGDRTSRALSKSLTSITPVSICGTLLHTCIRTMPLIKGDGSWRHKTNSTMGASKAFSLHYLRSVPLRMK